MVQSLNVSTDCGSLRFNVDKIRKGYVQRESSYSDKVDSMSFGAVDRE
jgi:hypothetical protein